MAVIVPFLIGVVAGLRTMTAPAAIAWAGWLDLAGTWAGFLASPWAVAILTALALGEFVADQMPSTPSRTVPVQLDGRVLSGAFSGAALGAVAGSPLLGLVAGAVGAAAGTYGGAAARARTAAALGRDRSAALIEDAVALLGGLAVAVAP